MSTVVLDASSALQLVLRLQGFRPLASLLRSATTVAAPRLFAVETANALWKYVGASHLTESEAINALREALGLVAHPIDDVDMAVEALSTAARYHHPVYDAMYATLARRLGGAVATRDGRLRELLAALRIDAIP